MGFAGDEIKHRLEPLVSEREDARRLRRLEGIHQAHHFIVKGQGEGHSGHVDPPDVGELFDEFEAGDISSGVVTAAATAPGWPQQPRTLVLSQRLRVHRNGGTGTCNRHLR